MATARNRDYSSPPDTYHSMAATYAWNPYAVITGATNPQTGAWSSVEMSQDGALRVSLTSGISVDSINISGINVNTDQLETINTSGSQYLASISGDIRFLRTGSYNNPIGVTGTRIDVASGYATGTYLMVGGRAVEIASGFNPQYGSGSNAMLNIARDNGALLTQNTDLSYIYDSVVSYTPQSSVVSNSTISGSFAATALQTGIALPANTGRKNWFVQNTSNTNPLYVRFSASAASTGNFNLILNPSSSAGQGGGSFTDSSYMGAVSVSGTSLIIWELT
jgi:hypothetical protein